MKIRKSQSKESLEFWDNADKAQKNVERWPEWKRNIQLTKYSNFYQDKKAKCGNP